MQVRLYRGLERLLVLYREFGNCLSLGQQLENLPIHCQVAELLSLCLKLDELLILRQELGDRLILCQIVEVLLCLRQAG